VNILDWFKNKNEQQTNNVDTSDPKKKFKISDWFTSTPTELDENGNPIPVSGAKAVSDPYKVAIPLLLSYMAVKSPESGVPMLSGYLGGRQQQLEQQKEDAWKQWQVRANQKRQALEDERYNIEHPVYTVPTVNNVTGNNAADYGQMFTANPQSLNFNLGGSYKPTDKFQNQINNIGQLSDQNNPNMWVVGGANPQGMIEKGNVDLLDRPQVKNKDGSVSTVRSMSFNEDGKEILVPTVSWDGKILSNKEAIEQYHKTGQHLGVFDSEDAANNYAEQLHNSQADLYTGKKQLPFLSFNQGTQQTPAQSNAVAVQPQQSIFQPGQKVSLKMFQEQQEKQRQKQEKAAAKQSEIDTYSNYLSNLPQDSRYRGEFENAIKHPEMYDIDSMRKIFYNETAPKQKQIDYSGITFSEKNPYFKIAQNNPKSVTQDIIDKAVKWETDNSQSGYKSQEQGLKLREMGLNLKLSEARLKEINVRTNKILSGDGKGGKGSKTASQEQKDRLNGIAAAAAQYKSSADYIADLKRNSSAFINEFGATAYNKLVAGAEKLPVWQKIVKKDPKTGKITNRYGQGVAFTPNQSSPLRRFFPSYVSQQQVKTTAQQSIEVKRLKPTDKLNPAITTAIKKAMNGKPEDVAEVSKKYGFKEDELYLWYKNHK
jgi:hypothetical protein